MRNDVPALIKRSDYKKPNYLVKNTFLLFKLFEDITEVISIVDYYLNPELDGLNNSVELLGHGFLLNKIILNDNPLDASDYILSPNGLVINDLPNQFTLEIHTEINPDRNTTLEGLYRSNGNYCTQCEAEGFRTITYYQDRPDILATFTTRIEADKKICPVLLSNGNLEEKGDISSSRHYVVWKDPHPKPSYLFALVAGDLKSINDTFITDSGKEVFLQIFVEERNITKCDHAMLSLKKSMKWDEDTFGLEYDLDTYMIVAVDDFNMGAMENKGLNVFNSKYVLALPETATDDDFKGIESVIGHEYFHNWTGNRVTCRDWFQLSLKEGLTVFRDQEFSSDLNSRSLERIDAVNVLRNHQFKEDSSAMAHPIRPDSYVEINNFYTVTVYNKGAEVIRMMHTLLGADNFRAGMDLYFERHDGQAVTCDDFVSAMSDASKINLDQFQLWYSQAGTPILNVQESWNKDLEEYEIAVSQFCPSTPGQESKEPFHIPICVGLLDKDGKDILPDKTITLELRKEKEKFTFKNMSQRPTVSFLRNFSAPVIVKKFQSKDDLAFILANDSDDFNRWEAAQTLFAEVIFELVDSAEKKYALQLDTNFIEAIRSLLITTEIDPALVGKSIIIPDEKYIATQLGVADPDIIHGVISFVRTSLANACYDELVECYNKCLTSEKYQINQKQMADRALKNTVLRYLLVSTKSDVWQEVCEKQYYNADNMTDSFAALKSLTWCGYGDTVLTDFFNHWQNDTLVMDKWFMIQAMNPQKNCLNRVKQLMDNPQFSIHNPNKVRSLIGAFAGGNHLAFHHESGSGYSFLTDRIIELNGINPQIAARLVSAFGSIQKYDVNRQDMMKKQLLRILAVKDLSKNVYEIASKTLGD
ncbi:MAG: aminopeptidase N [Desulfotalea sp.]